MARIAIVTSGHLSTSPRVWREADALAAAGHAVTATGVWLDARQAEWDLALLAGRGWSWSVAADLRGGTIGSRLARTRARVRSRAGRSRVRLRLGDDPHALGYAVDKLERVARREHADLTILHLEPALWIGERLLARGWRIAVDIEDWYSENHPELARRDPQVAQLARLESRVFRAARSATTTSAAMARALAAAHGMAPPAVVYNSLREAPLANAAPSDELRLLWLSQTVGMGRGLEDLVAALRRLPASWRLTLVGSAPAAMRAWARAQLGDALFERVRWQSRVAPQDLYAIVTAHDVGLALEVPVCRNKDLTVSNKLLHYLQGGLAALASDTAGQREVMEQVPGAGAVYRAGNADALAGSLAPWLENPAAVQAGRAARHRAANDALGLHTQVPRLVASVARALDGAGA